MPGPEAMNALHEIGMRVAVRTGKTIQMGVVVRRNNTFIRVRLDGEESFKDADLTEVKYKDVIGRGWPEGHSMHVVRTYIHHDEALFVLPIHATGKTKEEAAQMAVKLARKFFPGHSLIETKGIKKITAGSYFFPTNDGVVEDKNENRVKAGREAAAKAKEKE